jgi:hypothetical protein
MLEATKTARPRAGATTGVDGGDGSTWAIERALAKQVPTSAGIGGSRFRRSRGSRMHWPSCLRGRRPTRRGSCSPYDECVGRDGEAFAAVRAGFRGETVTACG